MKVTQKQKKKKKTYVFENNKPRDNMFYVTKVVDDVAPVTIG